MEVLAVLLAAAGIIDNIVGFSNPETLFLTALVAGILAVALAIDEARLSTHHAEQPLEVWFSRITMIAAGILGAVGFVLGLLDSDVRNAWSAFAVILAIVSVGAAVDLSRLALARGRRLRIRANWD